MPITTHLDSIYNEAEERIKNRILQALDKVNNSLNTHFCIVKIYYDPSHDIEMIGTYELLTIRLIRHYFERNELDEFNQY